MSDLHGYFSKFIRMLRRIKFDETDNMIILGNVVDGGPQPVELLTFISQQKNIRMSVGLHEMLMLQALLENRIEVFDKWVNNLAGKLTYEAYKRLDPTQQHYLLNYLKESCPSFFITDIFFMCSSGIKLWREGEETNLTTEKPKLKEVLEREENNMMPYLVTDINFYRKAGLADKITIFGEISVQQIRQNMDYKIWRDPIYDDKICINSGVSLEPHKMACLRLNDLAEFYV